LDQRRLHGAGHVPERCGSHCEQRQAFANAALLQKPCASPATDVTQLVESVDTLPGSRSVLRTGGQWYATSILRRPERHPRG